MLFLLALCTFVPHAVEGIAPGECDDCTAVDGQVLSKDVDVGYMQSLIQVDSFGIQRRLNAGEGNANLAQTMPMGHGRAVQNLEDPDPYWIAFDTRGDIDNVMPLSEAQALDGEVASLENFDSLPPLAPLLYPYLVDQHDSDILEKLQNLTRDSQLVLPDGTKIPYWQTLQYVSRSMRVFLTRFVEGTAGNKVFDNISAPERVVVWEMASLLRKLLVTDCVKQYIESDPTYPDTITYSAQKYRGAPFSGAIFYKHLEGDVTASYMRLGVMNPRACAYATGVGITFNNITPFSEKNTKQFVGCYSHEQAHNMGYHHRDRAPGGIQTAVLRCYNKNRKYTTYDLTAYANFQVE